jgi:hypothetical protein
MSFNQCQTWAWIGMEWDRDGDGQAVCSSRTPPGLEYYQLNAVEAEPATRAIVAQNMLGPVFAKRWRAPGSAGISVGCEGGNVSASFT